MLMRQIWLEFLPRDIQRFISQLTSAVAQRPVMSGSELANLAPLPSRQMISALPQIFGREGPFEDARRR